MTAPSHSTHPSTLLHCTLPPFCSHCRYGVPAGAAALFEAAFRKALPDAFAAQPDLLFQLVTQLSPRVLQRHGVPVCCATQVRRTVE